MKRTPKNYDGNLPTTRQLRDLLPDMVAALSDKVGNAPYQVLEAWNEVVGERIGKHTRAVSFDEGVLRVQVRSSTLLSLLTQHEKKRLIAVFRNKFPKVHFKNILFKIG